VSFHVPERARVSDAPKYGSDYTDGNNGVFDLDSPEPGWRLAILASDGGGWEHVSAHAYRNAGRPSQQRCPTWKEMSFLKRVFWDPDDVAMQLHPRESEYVNEHPFTLHLWRPTTAEIPTPPPIFVGTR
jgi:hypothetical protein